MVYVTQKEKEWLEKEIRELNEMKLVFNNKIDGVTKFYRKKVEEAVFKK